MTTPNICMEQSCSKEIRRDHYLCYPHWGAMRAGSINECPECAVAYKPVGDYLCAECKKKAQEKPRSARDNPVIDDLVNVIESIQRHIERTASLVEARLAHVPYSSTRCSLPSAGTLRTHRQSFESTKSETGGLTTPYSDGQGQSVSLSLSLRPSVWTRT